MEAGGLMMSSYIYTNWRGKQFVIDEMWVEDFKNYLLQEGSDPEFVATFTPERLMRDLPIYESLEREQQLEDMWEKATNNTALGE
jgi:hypothetical protein